MSHKRWLVLIALTAGPALVEATILRALGFSTAMSLAPQAGAPSPYGTFHDLRWIFVYHNSWTMFGAELAAAIVFRALLTIGIVAAAWPPDENRPPIRALVADAFGFSLVAAIILSPWAVVAVAASETSLSWFVLGEVIPVLILGLVLARGGIPASRAHRAGDNAGGAHPVGDGRGGSTGWWRGLPTAALLGWGAAGFAVVTIGGLLVGFTPGWGAVPVAGAVGAVNGVVWRRVVLAGTRRAPRLRRVPAAPIVIVVILAGLLATGEFAMFGSQAADRPIPPITGSEVADVHEIVIYVAGYDSGYTSRPASPGLPLEHFSYRGLDPTGTPLPYGPLDTHQSLATSAALLRTQVARVHQRTGRPVALVAQSEGTLVVRAYLASGTHPNVTAAVLLSPLVRPGRVYFPPRQADSGWGIAAGWLLRGMLTVVRRTGGPPISADEPFIRSILDNAVRYRDRMLCPVPGVRMVAFIPLASAVVVPPGQYSWIPVVGLPGLHASLLGRRDVQRDLLAFLAGRPVDGAPELYYPVLQKAAAAWQVPALALRLNPVWHAADQPDVAFGDNGCTARH